MPHSFNAFLRLTMPLYLSLLHVKCDCRNPDAFNKEEEDKSIAKSERQEGSNDPANIWQALQNGEEVDVNAEDEKSESYLLWRLGKVT